MNHNQLTKYHQWTIKLSCSETKPANELLRLLLEIMVKGLTLTLIMGKGFLILNILVKGFYSAVTHHMHN